MSYVLNLQKLVAFNDSVEGCSCLTVLHCNSSVSNHC